ncbi:hypothetical protein FNV43_RR06152 [Rhamnella rubrinervis]|uniref:Uncharacterized protein n=1 Tax=Rhamnella rubrinervis TaxID=2594499 RepID=A0A8K0HE12_9ROSA|nr:hypothetical protein FNV43_RR06152 [Rhamnella rubrinervis]
MRKFCSIYDNGLETVLEVPIPDEMFASTNKHTGLSWRRMKSWIKSQNSERSQSSSMTALFGSRSEDIKLLLDVVGAPLIALPISSDYQPINRNVKDLPIEISMAKYIVKQYVAAVVGGEKALNSIDSMYAMGKVMMETSEFCAGDGILNKKVVVKGKRLRSHSNGGGGSDGRWLGDRLLCTTLTLLVAHLAFSGASYSSLSQGLDPMSTAKLFDNSVCMGEKTIEEEDCFILKVEAEPSMLRAARSCSNVDIMRRTVKGYFSQRTGLLLQLEDSHLLRIKTTAANDSSVWETTTESLIQDYRMVDGINIAHGGRTRVSLFRLGKGLWRTRMEEVWEIEEVDFNMKGLSKDFFLPPADLNKEEEEGCDAVVVVRHRICLLKFHRLLLGLVLLE